MGVSALCLGTSALAQVAEPAGTTAGTVETIAGPGFCDGAASRDGSSGAVRALAVDGAGDVFVDTGRPSEGLVATVDSTGRVSWLVTGAPTAPGPGGVIDADGTEAPVASRLVADGRGGIILTTGSRIVQIDAGNGLSTLAGDPAGQPGGVGATSSGDGGPALAARFVSARSIATDEAGNLYIADRIDRGSQAFRVRVINRGTRPVTVYPGSPQQITVPPGGIDTIAGGPGTGVPGDGTDARRATLTGVPPAMAVAAGRLFIATDPAARPSPAANARVLVVNLMGTPTRARGTAVGTGSIGTVAVGVADVPGITADAAGNVLLADELHQRILRVDPAGAVTTIAGVEGGTDAGGFNGNGRPAVGALLNRPVDVKLGPDNRVYIADQLNNEVRVIDGRGVIHVARGGGMSASWSCTGGAAEGASPGPPSPGAPSDLAVDSRGTVFVTLPSRHQVKRLDGTGLLAPVAGSGAPASPCQHRTGGCLGDGGPPSQAALDDPSAVAINRRGDLYILDSGATGRVRYVNLGADPVTVHGVTVQPLTITTVVGNGTAGMSGDGGPATMAQLGDLTRASPIDPLAVGPRVDVTSLPDPQAPGSDLPTLGSLAVDGDGYLFIADAANRRVRMVDPRGIISTFAGEGAPAPRDRCCADPTGLAVDASGNLVVSDLGRSSDRSGGSHPRVWAINRTPRPAALLGQTIPAGDVQPVAGNGSPGIAEDGARALDQPLLETAGVVVDRRGDLYLAESGDIRRVSSSGITTTVMGTGRLGFNGDGLDGRLTGLSAPAGVALDPCGNLLVADLGSDRIRRLDLNPRCIPFAPPVAVAERPGGFGGRAALVAGVALVAGGAGAYSWRRRRAGGRPGGPRR